MQWLKTAAHLIWESIGGKLAILPAVSAALVARVDLTPGQVIALGSIDIQVSWIVASAIVFSWLIGGLLIKAVKLQLATDLIPIPNMSARDGFQHVMLHSKWAVGRHPDDGNIYQDVDREIGREARLGRLKVWGELRPSMNGGFAVRPKEFRPEDWEHLHFDYPSCVSQSDNGAVITDYSGKDWIHYERAALSQNQLFALWPKANWFERLCDKTRQDRLSYFKGEQKQYRLR